jgi:hypothetical protein
MEEPEKETIVSPVDNDDDGYTEEDGDCDDSNPLTYPGAAFLDSEIDCMTDKDGDGFGDITALDGIISGTDCDDDNDLINPDASEICNEIDDNCNNEVDDDDDDLSVDAQYVDEDSDGYGSNFAVKTCETMEGHVAVKGDCNDSDPNINPGALEIYGDEIDNDCDYREDRGCGDQGGAIIQGSKEDYVSITSGESVSLIKLSGKGGVCNTTCGTDDPLYNYGIYIALSSNSDCSDTLDFPYSVEYSPTEEIYVCIHKGPDVYDNISGSCSISYEGDNGGDMIFFPYVEGY